MPKSVPSETWLGVRLSAPEGDPWHDAHETLPRSPTAPRGPATASGPEYEVSKYNF